MNVARCIFVSGNCLSINNLTLKAACIKNYAFKSDLKIKWVRPEKIPCIDPRKSGDLDHMPNVDLTQPQHKFRNSKELETANETVKRLFSLEFAPRRQTTMVYFDNVKDIVRRHDFDKGSIEVKIARWTGIIRAYQELMERFPRDKKVKVILKEMIDRRKKHLKYLRRWDYKKFEWMLEKLNIVYKAPPSHFHWITRKESLQKLTDKYCDEIRRERLQTYQEMLQAEQPVFLQEKIRALTFIRSEQEECGVEVTVTQEEIDAVKKQLEDLEKERQQTKQEE